VSELLNPRHVQIALADGAVAEIVANPMDGVLFFVRYLSAPADSSIIASEEMVFAQDIDAIVMVR
jgi:hypothetical protein